MAKSTYRRLAVALILGGLLLASPPAAVGGLIWDVGIASGYVCVLLVICLYVFPLRGDGLPHSRLFGLSQHRRIGWWTLATALTHIVVLLISQPSAGRYLLPSAPVFMWCGVAAAIFAVVLIQTGLATRSALRRPKSPDKVQKTATLHVTLAAAMVLGLCAHVLGSSQYARGVPKTVALCVLLALPLGWFALRRRPHRSGQSATRRAAHIAAVMVIPLLPLPTTSRLLLEPAAHPDRIAVNFPHDSHNSVNCVTCHHNFVDHTGMTACVDCHRSERPDLPRSSEATFHTFCRDCHTQLALRGGHHGPTRSCTSCHGAAASGNPVQKHDLANAVRAVETTTASLIR